MCLKKILFVIAISASGFGMAQTTKPAPAKKPAASASSPNSKAAVMARGEKVYKISCITCHQMDANGVPYLNPPLVKTPFVLGDKKKLIHIIVYGKTEPVEIDGVTYNNPMPAQVQLNDQQIADVLSYVRNNFGNKASLVTPAEVKAVRAAKK
jgi:mono/diheme cytochrome c family protein